MNEPLKIAVAGLGNVGIGVVKILKKHKQLIMEIAGREVKIIAVSAKSRKK